MDCFEYVSLAKNGDKDAFIKLYQIYRERLYHYAWYRIGNSEDAMDAVSDTVLSAFENIGKLKNSKAFSSWLFSIHIANCNKYIKAVIKRRSEDNIDDFDIPCSEHSSGLSIELREALSKLDKQEKEIVLLSVIAGFTSEEIAQATGYKAGSVRSRQSRALAKMRKFLE